MALEGHGYATYLSLVAILAYLSLIMYRRYFSSLSDIPGPFLGSFGVWWQIYHAIKGHTEEETIALHERYGDFVRIGYNEVSVSHPDAISDVLKSHMNKGDWYKIFSLPDSRYVNLMSEVNCTAHIRKTKNVQAGYSFSNILKMEPYIDQTVSLLRVRLHELAESKQQVNFDEWFNFAAFDILGEATFSQQFGFLQQGRDIGNAIANTRALGLYVAIMGHFWWLHDYLLANPLIGYFNLQPTMHIFDTCLAAVDSRSQKSHTENQHRKDMLQQWIDAQAKHPERMEKKEILAAAVANIGAGADTVSATLQALVYHLTQNEDILRDLQRELDDAKLSTIPTHEETQHLPLLQACIKESLRFHTPVAFGLPRVVPPGAGLTIRDRHFQPGVILSVNPWVIHRRREVFGDDADVFNPRRWLDGPAAVTREMERNLIAFGAGYGMCPGRHLAMLEMAKIAVVVVRDFDVRRVKEREAWRFESRFTAVPYGWPCFLRVRSRD